MVNPGMFAGLSYRLCLLMRSWKKWLEPEMFQDPSHMFGGIPIVVMLGDFMQLAPIQGYGSRVSLIMEPQVSWQEEFRIGVHMFAHCFTHVLFLTKTHRFVDRRFNPPKPCDIMPRLLEFMRNPRGRKIDEAIPDVWAAVQQWEPKSKDDDRLKDPWIRGGYEMGISWDVCARLLQYRAYRESREAGQMLFYSQAVDSCRTMSLERQDYVRALQVTSLTNTGRLLGMCPFFMGMSVRLCAKVCSRYGLVHDAVGEVVAVEFHPMEKRVWEELSHDCHKRGFHCLEFLPLAVYVRVKDFTEDVGAGVGVVPVKPARAGWEYKTVERRTGKRGLLKLRMGRNQIPIAPERVRTCQIAQGMSMDACKMYLPKPGWLHNDDYWMHLYVMLSRVSSSYGIVAYALPR